jgi:transposase-like protein
LAADSLARAGRPAWGKPPVSRQNVPSDPDANIRSASRRRRMDRDSLTALLTQGLSVEKIAARFGKHPSTVSYWMAKYGLEAPNRAKHAAKGGIERGRLEELVGDGMTIAEIAGSGARKGNGPLLVA